MLEVVVYSDAIIERGFFLQVPVIQEEEEEEEEIPETRIEVEIPKINTSLGKNLFFVKLPNFLSVETR